MKNIYLTFILFFSSLMASGQSVGALKKQGDIYFNNLQYTKAIDYYQAVLEVRNSMGSALYQLGECYRLTMEFESAEKYYDKVATSYSHELFPLARYYLGLMKKMQGKFKSAEQELMQMTHEMKKSGMHENPKYRPYYEQARVEIAGCKLALRENKNHGLGVGLALLGDPVSSEYNDFAVVCMENDSSIILSSARKESKGIYVDFTSGEYFTDFFRYQFNGQEWVESEEKDKFPSIINTKWGEGSGSYLESQSVFYFTSCTWENETCFIYKTEKVNGTWSAPVMLNQNINQPGFNSKHPYISSLGDTLYFSSNREGGQGGFDIWYAVKDDTGTFGKPHNLGEHLNTFLDEISPFYDRATGVLFFASNGHKGFGGYDIFMAKGESFHRLEIFNIGLPFNSYADDCFFTLGKKNGYISSNRGAIGKFNVLLFSHQMDSNKEFIQGLEDRMAIAGRQSLYQNDYVYDSPDNKGINRIISQFLANRIAGLDLVLTKEDQEFYDGLSMDDKDRIHRIVNARYRKMTESDLRALRVQEYFTYSELGPSNRDIVDEIVYSRLEQNELGYNLRLNGELNFKYDHLDSTDREKVDQIITNKVSRSKKEVIKSNSQAAFSEVQKSVIDAITRSYFKHKTKLTNLPLRPNLLLFIKENSDNQAVWTAIREQTISLSKSEDFQLNEDDRIFFQNLSEPDLRAIKKLASMFVIEDIRDVSFDRLEQEIKTFDRLNLLSKGGADRILARFIHNYVIADFHFVETTYGAEINMGYATNEHSINELLDDLSKEQNHKTATSGEHGLRLERFVAISSNLKVDRMATANHMDSSHDEKLTSKVIDNNTPITLVNYVVGDLSDFKIYDYQFINISGHLDKPSASNGSIFPVGLSINEEVIYETYTDVQGNFEFEDIPSENYQILALNHPEGSSVVLRNLNVSGFKTHVYQHQLNSVVYFNSGESTLRPESKASLTDIAELIKMNPNIKVEFHGHTDSVGDEALNESLSKERSEAAFHFLTSLGATPQKIMINFHGLSSPVSDNTTPYGRQFNRRVEIKIQSNSPIKYHLPTIFLVKPNSTLYSISKQFGMDIDEIMHLNGLTSKELKAYQPLRLYDNGNTLSIQDLVVKLNNFPNRPYPNKALTSQ